MIGTGIFCIACGPLTDMLAADVKYAVVQGNITDEQTDITSEFPQVTEGTVEKSDWTMPASGEQYGEISCEEAGLQVPLYYGDTYDILEKGVGQSMLSVFPGQTGTTLVGGHDTTFFAPLEKVEKGMDIVVNTTYGRYTYTVEDISIIDGADYDISSEGQQLVLYTCYPFGDIVNNRSQKILYTCSFKEGPVIGGVSDENK